LAGGAADPGVAPDELFERGTAALAGIVVDGHIDQFNDHPQITQITLIDPAVGETFSCGRLHEFLVNSSFSKIQHCASSSQKNQEMPVCEGRNPQWHDQSVSSV
jgi:hypothetical protein